jgi:hypothetical protein
MTLRAFRIVSLLMHCPTELTVAVIKPAGASHDRRLETTRSGRIRPRFLPKWQRSWQTMNRFDGHEMTSRYLWAEQRRWREAHGDMSIVRHADDLVIGFEHDSDARHFREAMRERSEAFSLSLHPEKRPEPLRGVLKELAELHGLDGHELSRWPLPMRADGLPNASSIGRTESKRLVAHARARRSPRISRMLPAAGGSALAAFRRLLQPRRRPTQATSLSTNCDGEPSPAIGSKPLETFTNHSYLSMAWHG